MGECTLTFMLWVHNELSNHRLDHTYVAIERAAKEAAEQSHPKIEGEADD